MEELTDITGQHDLRNQASAFPDGRLRLGEMKGGLFSVLPPSLAVELSVYVALVQWLFQQKAVFRVHPEEPQLVDNGPRMEQDNLIRSDQS